MSTLLIFAARKAQNQAAWLLASCECIDAGGVYFHIGTKQVVARFDFAEAA